MNRILSAHILGIFVCIPLLTGCADKEVPDIEAAAVPLQLEVSTVSGSAVTRSVVSQTGTANGQVGQIGICLALNADGHTAYADPSISSALFTLGSGGGWTASRPVNLRSAQARLYAWYPATADGLATADNGATRTIPINLPAVQTYDGASTVACSQADYLYGSAGETPGDAGAITVNRDAPTAQIHLQHALSQVVFTIEYKPGRVPDAEYDWVKSISLEGPFRAGTGTMQLSDGVLAFPAQSSAVLTFKAESNPQLPGNIGNPATVAYGLAAPKAATSGTVTVKLVLGQKSVSTDDRTLTTTTNLFNAEWVKGVRYTYKLLLDKNDITLKNVAIQGWTEVPPGDPTEVPPFIE